MISISRHQLFLIGLVLWLGGCAAPPPGPYGGAPVVDHSIRRAPPPASPSSLPPTATSPVQANPLARPEPLRPQDYPSTGLANTTAAPDQVPPVASVAPSTTPPTPSNTLEETPPVSTPPSAQPPASTAPPAASVSPRPASPSTPPPAEITGQGKQAVAALLNSASQHVKSGELDKAAASLERALRIEPKNASIWYDLAQIRLHQHQYQQAESLAVKSNSLAGSNNALRTRNWRLIAVSRRAMGNNAGADEAEAQAVVLQR